MTAPDETLTPDSSDDLAAELAFALRFQGRKPVEIIAPVPSPSRIAPGADVVVSNEAQADEADRHRIVSRRRSKGLVTL
jgi:hypothetical protein